MKKKFEEHACGFKNESECEEELDEDFINFINFEEEAGEFGE